MVKSSVINKYVREQKGLSERQKNLLKEKSEQTWFRQYAKKSKEHLIKITKTVKKQIKENKGNYYSEHRKPQEDRRGFIAPKQKKRITKKQMHTQIKKEKLTRKEKQEVERITRRAPSGRVYSPTEIREGVGSKRSMEYRERKGILKSDYSKKR